MQRSITSKQLRQNMKNVLLQASRGESIRVNYGKDFSVKIVQDSEQPNVKKATIYEAKKLQMILNKASTLGTAKDASTSRKDREILRKRLVEKYGK